MLNSTCKHPPRNEDSIFANRSGLSPARSMYFYVNCPGLQRSHCLPSLKHAGFHLISQQGCNAEGHSYPGQQVLQVGPENQASITTISFTGPSLSEKPRSGGKRKRKTTRRGRPGLLQAAPAPCPPHCSPQHRGAGLRGALPAGRRDRGGGALRGAGGPQRLRVPAVPACPG